MAGVNLHLTLCFLGALPESEIPGIVSACSAAVSEDQLRLELGEALWLPPRRPRVLAVRLRDVAGTLGTLQARLSEALAAGGWYKPERRAYLPHVTVARVRGEGRWRDAELPALPRPGPFSGGTLTLMRSHLGRGGARYERLWALPLR